MNSFLYDGVGESDDDADIAQLNYPRLSAIQTAYPDFERYFLKQVIAIKADNSSLKSKRKKFFQLADAFNKTVEKFAVCHKGCGHCCYLPTMIYAHEAELISQVTGIQVASVIHRERATVLAEAIKHLGAACPFLDKENSCSIYEHRPLICRLHHSLNDNADDCTVMEAGSRQPIVRMDADLIEHPYHVLIGERAPNEPWGSIKMFFPNHSHDG